MATELKIKNCPDEVTLSNYLTGNLKDDRLNELEEHLGSCPYCIYKLAEAKETVNEFLSQQKEKGFFSQMKKINIWITLSIIMFILSFIFPRYFMQFLVGAVLFWTKWVVDNKNTKMLITIYEAWKNGDSKEADKIFGKMGSKFKR